MRAERTLCEDLTIPGGKSNLAIEEEIGEGEGD